MLFCFIVIKMLTLYWYAPLLQREGESELKLWNMLLFLLFFILCVLTRLFRKTFKGMDYICWLCFLGIPIFHWIYDGSFWHALISFVFCCVGLKISGITHTEKFVVNGKRYKVEACEKCGYNYFDIEIISDRPVVIKTKCRKCCDEQKIAPI